MKKLLLSLTILMAVSCFAMPLPKIYLPFEGTDGWFDKDDPVWMNRAPGIYDQIWYGERGRLGANSTVPGKMPTIAVGTGVAGSDCMDLTACVAKNLGTLYYGGLANTADAWFSNTPSEDAFDNAMSVTVMGWFNTNNIEKAIGYDDQLNARIFNKYSHFQVLMNQGRFGVMVNGTGSWAYSAWNSYSQTNHKGQWVFFAITYDGTIAAGNNMKFYVGTTDVATAMTNEATTGVQRGPINKNLGQYMIVGNYGIGSTHGASSFNGLLDNIRVFSSYTDASGALDLNNLELYRQIDLGITEPDDAEIYFAGDIDQNYTVGAGDLNILAAQWLDDLAPSIPSPVIHLTFDNTDGLPFDESDPAFANQGTAGTGELPSMIMRIPETDPNYAEYPDGISLAVSPDGISGGSLDLTSRPMSALASMLVYGNTDPNGTDTAMQQALDWPISLTFTCWWKHSQVQALTSAAHILHRVGELSFWAARRVEPTTGYFGEIGFVPNDDDANSGNMIYSPFVYPETDQWVFFAFTVDMLLDQTDLSVGRIKWYRGTINQPVTLHTQVKFPLDEIMAPAAGNPLVIGNSSFLPEEALGNFSALIDELRLYVSKTNSSAALTVAQLEAIRQNDAQAYVKKQADVNKDSSVDFVDFSQMAANWLDSKTPFEMLP